MITLHFASGMWIAKPTHIYPTVDGMSAFILLSGWFWGWSTGAGSTGSRCDTRIGGSPDGSWCSTWRRSASHWSRSSPARC
ncbi:MAG: hypothetical protein QM774_02310 [Gordonia sp. (in: high G+C Gram-positive bacteria)]